MGARSLRVGFFGGQDDGEVPARCGRKEQHNGGETQASRVP